MSFIRDLLTDDGYKGSERERSDRDEAARRRNREVERPYWTAIEETVARLERAGFFDRADD